MNATGARVLITAPDEGRIWEAKKGSSTDAVFDEMRSTLPTVVRRTPRQRMEAMMLRIVTQAVESYRVTGRASWPASIERQLQDIAKRTNDPTLTQDGGIEQVIRQGKAIAQDLAQQGEMQQKAQDAKRTTRNWSGLY